MTPQEFANRIRQKYPNGVSSDGRPYSQIDDVELTNKVIEKYPVYASQVKFEESTSQEGFLGNVANALGQRLQNVKSSFGEFTAGKQDPISTSLQIVGQGAGAVGDVAGQALIGAAKTAVKALPGQIEKPVIEATKKVGTEFLNTPLGQSALSAVRGGVETYNEFKAKNPIAARNLEAVVNIGSLLPIGKGAQVAGKGTEVLATEVGAIAKTLTKPSLSKTTQTVVGQFEKGIKPSIAGKKTIETANKYKQNIFNAVSIIDDNKQNLKFVDDVGETIVGKNPETLKQFAESIDQSKKAIFEQYDTLAKQAGKEGVSIDLVPIATELDSVISNKALNITNPNAIRHAESVRERLLATGKIDTNTAQEVIQNYNKTLEAFYRNPTYDNASQAAIDAMIANKVRQSLDDGITGITGVEYQQLKNKYAALKTIENDVVKASLREARKNSKGLIDFTDIFSGGQIVDGILSFNPARIASGAAQKALATFYKYLNSPNRSIRKMFEAVEKFRKPVPQSKLIKMVK